MSDLEQLAHLAEQALPGVIARAGKGGKFIKEQAIADEVAESAYIIASAMFHERKMWIVDSNTGNPIRK
jgi:hypothetical protein